MLRRPNREAERLGLRALPANELRIAACAPGECHPPESVPGATLVGLNFPLVRVSMTRWLSIPARDFEHRANVLLHPARRTP
jgi:hypothetical protein